MDSPEEIDLTTMTKTNVCTHGKIDKLGHDVRPEGFSLLISAAMTRSAIQIGQVEGRYWNVVEYVDMNEKIVLAFLFIVFDPNGTFELMSRPKFHVCCQLPAARASQSALHIMISFVSGESIK
jgi:hypothetical protein